MKFVFTISILLLFTTACQQSHLAYSKVSNFSDNEILLSALLDENKSRFTYMDSSENLRFDELKEFKALESIYIKNIEPINGKTGLNEKQIKTIMFFAFYAKEKNSAAFQEYLASDLLPLYLKNTKIFLDILNRFPFLIEANCARLNAYFDFEGQQKHNKTDFLKVNKPVFSRRLNSVNLKTCYEHFD